MCSITLDPNIKLFSLLLPLCLVINVHSLSWHSISPHKIWPLHHLFTFFRPLSHSHFLIYVYVYFSLCIIIISYQQQYAWPPSFSIFLGYTTKTVGRMKPSSFTNILRISESTPNQQPIIKKGKVSLPNVRKDSYI
jgi:hypothetical protein